MKFVTVIVIVRVQKDKKKHETKSVYKPAQNNL